MLPTPQSHPIRNVLFKHTIITWKEVLLSHPNSYNHGSSILWTYWDNPPSHTPLFRMQFHCKECHRAVYIVSHFLSLKWILLHKTYYIVPTHANRSIRNQLYIDNIHINIHVFQTFIFFIWNYSILRQAGNLLGHGCWLQASTSFASPWQISPPYLA